MPRCVGGLPECATDDRNCLAVRSGIDAAALFPENSIAESPISDSSRPRWAPSVNAIRDF
jgi:hypothetical protein